MILCLMFLPKVKTFFQGKKKKKKKKSILFPFSEIQFTEWQKKKKDFYLNTLFCKDLWTFSLLFLHILLSSFFSPLGTNTEKTGISAGHTQAGKGLEVLLIFWDDTGFLFFVHLRENRKQMLILLFIKKIKVIQTYRFDGHDWTRKLSGHFKFLLL